MTTRRSKRITAIIDSILGGAEEHDIRARTLIKRLWRDYLRKSRVSVIAALSISVVWGALPLLYPLLSRFMVDQVLMVETGIPEGSLSHQIGLVWIVLALNLTIHSLEIVTEWFRSRLILTAGRRTIYELRRDLNRKLHRLHIGYFDHTPTGKIMSRVMDDVSVIREWVSHHSIAMVGGLARLAAGIVVMVCFEWRLSIIVIIALPLYVYSFIRIRPVIRRTHLALRRMNAQMYARATERVGAIEVVKAFAREVGELREFCKIQFNSCRTTLRVVNNRLLMMTCAGGITAVAGGLVLWLGALYVKRGDISLGSLIGFHFATMFTFMPMNHLAMLITDLEHVFVVLHRVFGILDEDWDDATGSVAIKAASGGISFEHVDFTYPGYDMKALADVSFTVQPGTKVAVMGPSGAGKSTLFMLLLRFYDPDEGMVQVGGVNLAKADPGSVRRHVRLVQQEPVVFSGTIIENVRYGSPESSHEQIVEACRQAELHEFIDSLPDKYESVIGENGVTLSGGQKQRLALATALLTQPYVLLLDDTTSALDAETEIKIRATLNKVLDSRSSLIITQRVMTARDCDSIMVFDQGRLTHAGTHAELRAQDGFYRRICEQQDCM